MKKILVGIVTVFFVTSMVMLLSMFVGCKSDVSIENKTGAIKGLVKYKNGNVTDYSGIQVTLSSTNGLMAISDCNSRGIATNGRAITNYCVTDVNGNYTFEDVPEGVYTIYASSNSSVEKAVLTNVVVTANETVTASDLNLTATGSIKGRITVNGKTENVLGLDVFIAGTSYVAKVGSDGSYEISGIPAKTGYMLCAQKGEQTFAIDTNIEVKANESVEVETYNITYTSTGGTSDSFTWIGSFAEAPENPTLYSAYFNTTDGCVYIWDGTYWVMLAQSNDDIPTNQITCVATEEGIKFGILFPEQWLCDHESEPTNCESNVLITDIKNSVTMYKAITSLPNYDYDPFFVVYPLVEAGKEYTFEVALKNGNVELYKRKFSVKAIGGLGEYKIENIDETEISLSENKILSRTLQKFTNNPKVPILKSGTYYTLTALGKAATAVWGDGVGSDIWLAEFWGDSITQDCDLKRINEYEGFEWGSYEYIDSRLKGGNLGVALQTRIKIAGYTYNDTAYFKLNDYMEQMFDWDNEESDKVFVMYAFGRNEDEPYFFKDIPGVEKYYILDSGLDGEEVSIVKEKTENAIEVYGTFIEKGQTINVPVYIPKLPKYILDTNYYSDFTGEWFVYSGFDDSYTSKLPLYVSDTVCKCKCIVLEPEFQLLKATANFYDEDGTLIDSETRENNNSNYYWNEIYLPSIPEKEGYIGLYWEDDYGNTYSDSRYANLTKPVTNFYPVYREAEKRTAYFYDENGNQIAEPIVAMEREYSSWWNEISLPSIPEKEGYIPQYWRDDYGNRYYNGSYANLNYNTNYFYAVYTEIPTEPENMKFSIEDITYGSHSGSFYVTEGNSYTVTWADSYEGKEELEYLLYTYNGSIDMCDVKVSVYDEYGNTYFTEVDSGYNNPQTFTANTTGYVTINVQPYSEGNSGYCAIKVTEN